MKPRSSPGRSSSSTAAGSCAATERQFGAEASMKLRLACSDYTFPLLPHDQVFKLIGALGFEGVDVGLFEDRSHLQPSHVMPNLARSANELSAKVRDQGLEFADVFYQASTFQDQAANHPDPEER